MQEQIYAKVRAFAEKNRMFDQCGAVAAGISGGGDSVTMLDILNRLKEEYGFQITAVHVNHGIRGAEAQRDQEAAEDLCRKMGIPCRVYCFDVPSLAAQWKIGLEEAGRRVRRQAFEETLAGAQISEGKKKVIALAHNRNDLAETMLHHLCRGTGLRGLSSMKAAEDGIVRPVLCLERKEIDEYLRERNLPYVTDSTNLQDEYTRNRIRHHVIPVLERDINEKTVSHMAETSELIGQAEVYFREKGASLAEGCRTEKGDILFGENFLKHPEIIRKYAVREAVERLAGQRKDISLIHVRAVLELFELRTGASVNLPYHLEAVKTYEGILIRKKKPEDPVRSFREYPLPVNGSLTCDLGNFETKIFSWSDQKICEKKYTKWLDYDRIKYDISVRTRKTGDYLTVNSQGHRKKLTRCMIDEKFPREQRDNIPLIAEGSEVLWIVGGRMNERYKITSETKNVLEIKYQGGKYHE